MERKEGDLAKALDRCQEHLKNLQVESNKQLKDIEDTQEELDNVKNELENFDAKYRQDDDAFDKAVENMGRAKPI